VFSHPTLANLGEPIRLRGGRHGFQGRSSLAAIRPAPATSWPRVQRSSSP